MIDKKFWDDVASNWILDSDGIDVVIDTEKEMDKVKGIKDEDLMYFGDITNDEIDDILADLGLEDI